MSRDSGAVSGDAWDPQQYDRFAAERAQPFFDLLALLAPAPGGRAVDLGCGTGALTRELHDRLQLAETVGIDSSPAMLADAAAHAGAGVRFEQGDVSTAAPDGHYDVVLSNACLQWVPDHDAVLARWAGALTDGGQLAVQMPANADHPAHLLAAEVAHQPSFLDALGGEANVPVDPASTVRPPEHYAGLLHRLGFDHQHVRLQVYGHVLESTAAVVEWVKGTSLSRFKAPLGDDRYERFVTAYRDRLVAELGDQRPFFYPFKRVLFAARR